RSTAPFVLVYGRVALPMASAHDEFGKHEVMEDPAVLEASHRISASPVEAVYQPVGVAGHRLHLGEKRAVGGIDGEAVIYVLGLDDERDRYACGNRITAQRPPPLHRHHLHTVSGSAPRARSEGRVGIRGRGD